VQKNGIFSKSCSIKCPKFMFNLLSYYMYLISLI
jgi:hypothetical protein